MAGDTIRIKPSLLQSSSKLYGQHVIQELGFAISAVCTVLSLRVVEIFPIPNGSTLRYGGSYHVTCLALGLQ
jgi:hypothetical protein